MGMGLNITFWLIIGIVIWGIYSLGEKYFSYQAAKECDADTEK
jgi:hypothetical protein